ncbi:putative ankyrin repeat protein [Cotonvirus japonicus]|uniref:Ankyrin repeat protein n=1 Tax=Cotonvirus japonicus TaxID=2811091 RepID=A0ABM7NTI3_9VIRU|nr:putative ankyrin repeat protein [Cotonvirus japonicus]BCS83416.1 putative ankyrin repeat protein [Cotonvirus japonicus]
MKRKQTTKYMTYSNCEPNYYNHNPYDYFLEDNEIIIDISIFKENNEDFFKFFSMSNLNLRENILLYSVCNDFDKIKLLYDNDKLITKDLNFILKTAIINNKYEILQFLIDMGIDLSIDNYCAMSCAPCSNNLEMVKLIVEHGQDVTINNNAAMINCIKYDLRVDLKILDYLIEKGADINAHDNFCIKFCVYALNFKLFKYLVDLGVDYKSIINYLVKTLIRRVGYCRNDTNKIFIEFIEFFISDGINFEFLSKKDINLCLKSPNKKIIELMMDNGANLSFINNYNFDECQENIRLLVSKIIKSGINPENFMLYYFEKC